MKDIALPRPRLEVRDLQVVLAVAATGSTAAAAPALHLSQPAVSRALLAAEERLGARLFDRTTRGLQPTVAGARLIAGASRLLGELGELERSVRVPAPAPTRLRLVCECYTAYHWLPAVLAELRETTPDLDLRLAVEHTRTPVEALVRGAIDVALLTTGTVDDPAVATHKLFADEIVFLVARDHPLACKPGLTRDDLRAHKLLSGQAPPAETRWFLARVFGRSRLPEKFERFPLTEALVEVARAGLGIAILSEWIAAPHLQRGDLVALRLASGPIARPWRIAWRRSAAGPARRLFAALRNAAPALS